jgi:hypothetical protein
MGPGDSALRPPSADPSRDVLTLPGSEITTMPKPAQVTKPASNPMRPDLLPSLAYSLAAVKAPKMGSPFIS